MWNKLIAGARKFCHNAFGWHDGRGAAVGFDGCSRTSRCGWCGERVLQDSQGNWFATGHPITKNASPEFRGLWEECREASEAVSKWPEWKRGELPRSAGITGDGEEVDGD